MDVAVEAAGRVLPGCFGELECFVNSSATLAIVPCSLSDTCKWLCSNMCSYFSTLNTQHKHSCCVEIQRGYSQKVAVRRS